MRGPRRGPGLIYCRRSGGRSRQAPDVVRPARRPRRPCQHRDHARGRGDMAAGVRGRSARMRLRRRKDKPDEGAEPVVRDAEGDPVEDPTVSGILPPLDAGAGPGGEAIPPPPPPPLPELAPEAPTAVEPEPVPVPEPAARGRGAGSGAGAHPRADSRTGAGPRARSRAARARALVVEPAPAPEPAAGARSRGARGRELRVRRARARRVPAPPSRSGRPELLVGAAFVGGVAIATVLRRLGRR